MKWEKIVNNPAPIVASIPREDGTSIVVRSNRTLCVADSVISLNFDVIDMIFDEVQNRIIFLDTNESIHEFCMRTATIKSLSNPAVEDRLNIPSAGTSRLDFHGEIFPLKSNSIIFRYDHLLVDMSLEPGRQNQRWYSPIICVTDGSQEPLDLSPTPESVIVGGIAKISFRGNPECICSLTFPTNPSLPSAQLIVFIPTLTTILDSIEISNVSPFNFFSGGIRNIGDKYVLIFQFDGSVIVVQIYAKSELRIHSIIPGPGHSSPTGNAPLVKRLSSIAGLPPLPSSMVNTPPKYNPNLTLIKKHGKISINPLISDCLLNMSLGPVREQRATGQLLPVPSSYISLGGVESVEKPLLKKIGINFRGNFFSLDFTTDRQIKYYPIHEKEKRPRGVTSCASIGSMLACMLDDGMEFFFKNAIDSKIDLVIQINIADKSAACGFQFLRAATNVRDELELVGRGMTRSIAIMPGSCSAASYEEDFSPKTRRTCGYAVAIGDHGTNPPSSNSETLFTSRFGANLLFNGTIVFPGNGRRIETGITESTCFDHIGEEVIVMGTFDGEVIIFGDRKLKVSKFSISDIVIIPAGPFVLVGDRSGNLYQLNRLEGVIHKEWTIGVLAVKICTITEGVYVVYSGEKIFLHANQIYEIQLGYPGIIKSVVHVPSGQGNLRLYALVGDGLHVFGITIDQSDFSCIARYTKNVPFENPLKFVQSSCDEMFVIATIPRVNQRALFNMKINPLFIGALESSECVTIESVLAFDEIKEEPVSLAIWHTNDIEIVAVGTCGRGNRGRLVMFEADSMTPIIKTYVPSKSVAVIEPISKEVLAIGCTDSLVLVSIIGDNDQYDLITVAVLQTYVAVKQVNRVDDKRFLVLLDIGKVVLCGLKDDEILIIAEQDIPRNVISPCVLIPPANEMFVCSTIDGHELVYSVADASESGVIRLIQQLKPGVSISSFSCTDDRAILGFSNGSIFEVSS